MSWIYLIPKVRGYRVRQEVLVLDNGATSHRLTKVPVAELDVWDASHDAAGRSLNSERSNDTNKKIDIKTESNLNEIQENAQIDPRGILRLGSES